MAPRSSSTSDPPAQPISGSYSLFRAEALRVAGLIDEVVLVTRKRADLYDARRIADGEKLAAELRHLAALFSRWPMLPAAEVAAERLTLGPRLAHRLRDALVMLEAMPTAGVLGRVKRSR